MAGGDHRDDPSVVAVIDLDDIIGLEEAGEISGRAEVTMRRAAALGTLEAKRIGTTYVTTREAVARYMAYVAANAWQSVPQRMAKPGGHARRGRRRRTRPAT